FWGIATIDISLHDLMREVRALQVGQTGYAFILSREGKFVTFPDQEKVMQSGLEEYDKQIAARMTSGQEGIEPFVDPVTGQETWILFKPIRSSGWSFAVVYPVKEILAGAIALQRRMFVIGVLGLLVIFGIITLLARTITRPLEAFVGTARRIADGDLDQALPPTPFEDEIHDLSTAFEKMMRDLKQYMKDLARTVSEKERIESELKIARDIQRSILPRTFPPFPEQNEFDIYAFNISAKEVGGDFYDFFYVDDRTLGFVIADVSGKGVPAALYMAVSRTLLKATALRGFPPGECLDKVNHLLIADNESTMFVTLFYGTIDVHTGNLQYANGGHNLPYIKRKNGDLECLSGAHGLILGIMEDATYTTDSVKLNKGDAVFLYTDGVNEAENSSSAFFGMPRLEACLKETDFSSVEEAVKKMKTEVSDFTGDAVQSDDITMMALQYMGEDGKEALPPQTT
ncbi:MAG TPA: SpoIIE family protein phosphatase, partial [bacterium]|nr:SpoIIE family protein phosphatase [bacterium]